MKDPNIVRLCTYGRDEDAPLNVLAWCAGASLPEPDRIGPIDLSKRYGKDSVIAVDENLMFATRTPKYIEAVPPFLEQVLDNDFNATAVKHFSFKEEDYVVISYGDPRGDVLHPLGAEPSAYENNSPRTNLYRWNPTALELDLVGTVDMFNNYQFTPVIQNESVLLIGRPGMIAGSAQASTAVAVFDGAVIVQEPALSFASGETLTFEYGPRKFVLIDDYQAHQVRVIEILSDDTLFEYASYSYAGEADCVKSMVYSLRDNQLNLGIALQGSENLLKTLAFRPISSTLEELYTFDLGVINSMHAVTIDSIEYLIITSPDEYVSMYLWNEELRAPEKVSSVTTTMDYQGQDITIAANAYNIDVHVDGDLTLVTIPSVFKNGTDAFLVTFVWDAESRILHPYRAVPNGGIYDFVSFETTQGRFGINANYSLSKGMGSKASTVCWDSSSKKFVKLKVAQSGGTVYNIDDWEELEVAVSYVPVFNENKIYRHDVLVTYNDEVYITRADKITGPWDGSLWDKVSDKQVVRTLTAYESADLGAELLQTNGKLFIVNHF